MFELLGRLHVLLVHFPIALLVVGGALELVNLRSFDEHRARAARMCIALGAAGAVVASVTGWIHADCIGSGGKLAGTLLLHRWFGIATALFACAAVMFERAASASATAAKMRLASVFLAAALVGVSGHFGGTLTHGSGYLLSAFDDEAAPVVPEPVDVVNTDQPLAVRARALLDARCVECHGDKKQKGDLRLDVLDQALREDEWGFVIKPGAPLESRLYERVMLPSEDEDHMPPVKSGPPLTQDELELLRVWIEAGAPVE